jgi:chemosensory pili system protein ChpA (sensor histidine kinase/response regulator)
MDSAAPPFVLIVDDQAAIRDLFASFLRRAGFEVAQARDGIEAVRRLRLRVPDAVVCDLEMPEMDGVAFCHSLRADTTTRAVPLVIVSGAGPLALGRALAAGCDAVLAKPCSGAVLVATLARLLDRSPTSSIHLPARELLDLTRPVLVRAAPA